MFNRTQFLAFRMVYEGRDSGMEYDRYVRDSVPFRGFIEKARELQAFMPGRLASEVHRMEQEYTAIMCGNA